MFIVLVAGVLALSSCSTIGPKQVAARKVTKGMTQRQVCALLGEPSGKDVAGNREIWSYYFSGISSSLTAEATFLKDTLVRYRFIEGEGPRYYLDKRSPQPPAVQQSPTPIPVPIPQQSVRERRYNEEERAFNDFLRQMSGMPFPALYLLCEASDTDIGYLRLRGRTAQCPTDYCSETKEWL